MKRTFSIVARVLASTLLFAALPACVTPGTGDAPRDSAHDEGLREKQAAAEAEKKLLVAEIELELAAAEAQSTSAEAARALRNAELELAEARKQLEDFDRVQVALRVDEGVLSLDQKRYEALEAEEELKELEAMYAMEEFAETTKELVLTRGRKHLEFAKREAEIEERKLADLQSGELREEREELNKSVREAESQLEEARVSVRHAELEARIALLKAELELEDVRREKPGDGADETSDDRADSENGADWESGE